MKAWKEAEKIVEGWQKDANSWWYQNADGTWPKSEWRLIKHHWYLFGANGYIRKGWHRWNPDTKQVDPDDGSGDWYYLQETGDLEGGLLAWNRKRIFGDMVCKIEIIVNSKSLFDSCLLFVYYSR